MNAPFFPPPGVRLGQWDRSLKDSEARLSRARKWTSDPRAKRILATFATRPAPVEAIPPIDRWDRAETRLTGFRVRLLGIIKADHQTPRFRAAQAAGDTATCMRIAAEPSVEDAVRSVVERVALAPVTVLGAGKVAA